MEEMKSVVVAKFKPEISPDEIDKYIKDFANLVNLIEPMKDFHWGTDARMFNMHQGFTHVFVSSFESAQGLREFLDHPAHVEFVNVFLPVLEKVVVVDYKPTPVQLN
ncbi:Stress-response A/B barrel domain-containing protein HS1 [Linum perenne]